MGDVNIRLIDLLIDRFYLASSDVTRSKPRGLVSIVPLSESRCRLIGALPSLIDHAQYRPMYTGLLSQPPAMNANRQFAYIGIGSVRNS